MLLLPVLGRLLLRFHVLLLRLLLLLKGLLVPLLRVLRRPLLRGFRAGLGYRRNGKRQTEKDK